jgi:predicted HTH transcriptional regulator
LLLQKLEDIDADFLRQLCDDKCPESASLDFKRELPRSSKKEEEDKDKQELLKDVCAFANTDGGDLVYGISDKDGAAEKVMPIVDEAADAAERRLRQVLDAGIEPRIQGIRFQRVEIDTSYVLIVRVPASFDGPHCARRDNLRRFVMRNGTLTSDMTYDQLRAAFDRTATLAEQARRFIDERLRLIKVRETPKLLVEGPAWVFT